MQDGIKKFGLSLVVVASFLVAYWRNHHAGDGALPPALTQAVPVDTVSSIPPSSPPTDTATAPAVSPQTSMVSPASTTSTPQATQGAYRNGTYTGSVADAFYGNVQVKVTIQHGRIAQVTFLDYPHDRSTSLSINSYATPQLAQQAVQAQSANVDGVSGASATSEAFRQSLASALSQAAA